MKNFSNRIKWVSRGLCIGLMSLAACQDTTETMIQPVTPAPAVVSEESPVIGFFDDGAVPDQYIVQFKQAAIADPVNKSEMTYAERGTYMRAEVRKMLSEMKISDQIVQKVYSGSFKGMVAKADVSTL